MNESARMPSTSRVLRRLYLTLFLRGRSSRGLQRKGAPKSVGSRLAFTLVMYAFIGLVFALGCVHRPVFVISLYLHSMTLAFLGMFVAASAGEVLFNKEESDILMHRPVTPKALLWAKVGVMTQVSLWLAGAFNLAGLLIGIGSIDSGLSLSYPLAHALSTACQALFCTSCIVLIYQLCLRWFGRERMEGLMTTAQVFVAIGAVMFGQIGPRMIGGLGQNVEVVESFWICLLPSAWFAGMDDAVAGTGSGKSWLLAGVGLAATAVVLYLAFEKLAADYERGLQTIGETSATPRARGGRRWLDTLTKMPPLSWWLGDSVSRASFLLTAAYLARDRDVKLRVYPGIAPMLVMPLFFLFDEYHPIGHARAHDIGMLSGYAVAFSGVYLGIVPLLGLNLIRYSQQWQASDLFRVAPMAGPGPLCNGARRAVLLFLTLPVLLVFGALALWLAGFNSRLALLLPGLVIVPLYAMFPCIDGKAVPLSLPTEEAKSASRGLQMVVIMLASAMLALVATWARSQGWFWWFMAGEVIAAAILYFVLRRTLSRARWDSIE